VVLTIVRQWYLDFGLTLAAEIGWHRHERPLTLSLPFEWGERIEKSWRGEAEPYPELGEGLQPDRKLQISRASE
jgi:hypothetical protein